MAPLSLALALLSRRDYNGGVNIVLPTRLGAACNNSSRCRNSRFYESRDGEDERSSDIEIASVQVRDPAN